MNKDPVHYGSDSSLLGSPFTLAKTCSSPGEAYCGSGWALVLHKQLRWRVCVWWFWSYCQQQGQFSLSEKVDCLSNVKQCYRQKRGVFNKLCLLKLVYHVSLYLFFMCVCCRIWNQHHPWTTSGTMISGEAIWVATLVTNPIDHSLSWHLGKKNPPFCPVLNFSHLKYFLFLIEIMSLICSPSTLLQQEEPTLTYIYYSIHHILVRKAHE